MDAQGNRGDMYAPYNNLESRIYAPAPENAQLELEDQRGKPGVPPKELYYDYSDTTKHASKRVITGWWGGSTWSWRGNCPRYLPSDFKLKSLFGVGRGLAARLQRARAVVLRRRMRTRRLGQSQGT